MLTALYPWIVFVHVAAAFGFVLAHGVAVFVGFRIRQERDRARIAALLDLSTGSLPPMYGSLLVLLVAGLTAGASISSRQARGLEALPPPECVEAELATRLCSRRPELLAAIGGGGLLTVIWLMVVKPF